MSYPKQLYIPVPENKQKYKPVGESNDETILTAIRMCNIEKCKELIAADSEILHRKGWNQLSPLHQACLSGQVHIVALFLQHGANPNARNSFEETPLHYACRRGVLSVVHMMIKNGADFNSVDKRGRNCMHFAALGGSVVMLHYLRSHTDLNFDTPDDTGQNILHIGCEMRQFPMICYLTKHNRVDPSLHDLRGITPLHIAVEKGHGDIAWILLETGGCELLRIKNQKGETPCDIAKNGGTGNHQGIFKTLLPYSKPDMKGPPRGPVFMWYFLLFLPFCYLAVMFLLTMYMNSYGGHFSLLMSTILLYLIGRQSHRMYHLCRWPNPIHMGTFVGGIVHCAIAQFGHLQRALWPCPFTIVLVTSLAALCLYLLWFLIFLDPGIDRTPKICPTTGKSMSVLDIAEGRASEVSFCPFSEVIHDIQTKYCRICEAPMLDLDHHCLFLNNCIARKNHRHFLVLLLVVITLQISFVYSSCMYMQLTAENGTFGGLGDPITPHLFHLYKSESWLFFLTVLCVVSCFWEATLVYAQFSVIMRGSTTYLNIKQMHRHHQRLTRIQMVRNLVYFFLRGNSESHPGAVNEDTAPLIHA